MAYLKPAQKTAALARQEKPEPEPQEGGPLPPLLPAPGTTDEQRQPEDPRAIDGMLGQMFSDKIGRKQRRLRH